MNFLLPWAAVLILPALLAWWTWGRQGHARWWRLLLVVVLVLAATGPEAGWGRGGSDVVLLLDRSASMPDTERMRQDELIRLVAEQRRSGDRLAVIAVARNVAVAQGPQALARPRLTDISVDTSASSLGDGLEAALAVIPPGRSARVVMHSDGEATGIDPARAAARLAAAGIVTDALPVSRPPAPDAAILAVEVPGALRLGESFIGAVRILSDVQESRRWQVRRGDTVLADGLVHLNPLQPTVVTFADRPDHAGLVRYTVEIEGAEGFAMAARIDRQQLITHLRSLARSSTLVSLAESYAGADADVTIDQLMKRLDEPIVSTALDQLGDATLREAALLQLETALAEKVPNPLAAWAANTMRDAVLASLVTDGDRQPLNNRAAAAIRIEGGERVLVLGGDGIPGNVAKALSAAGLVVTTRAEGPVSLGELTGITALVLDDVPADRLGIEGLDAIAHWTEHLGGGLVMLGGRRSFGAGGYRRSRVEDVLPVTLELRDEHRKLACSIAIAIDVSGSMSMPVADGRMKLDLANEGAVAVIELLGPRDRVAVFAVDSASTTILDLQPVTNPEQLANRVRGIQPGGGGIYVYEALAAAGSALLDATTGTRHLVLFSDAQDSEEPGDYVKLIESYRKAGITVSVIGMGSDTDSDAQLLLDVARRGGGRCTFASAAEDIPRLFAQETVLVARSAWVDSAAPLVRREPLDLVLGRMPAFETAWPSVPGYNLTYPRERAQVLVEATGDPTAPAVASWRIGTGRAVAIPFSCDDPESSELLAWPGYAAMVSGLVRWAAGGDREQAVGRLHAELIGHDALLRVELDPAQRARWPARAPTLALATDGKVGDIGNAELQPVDDGVWEARYRLQDDHAVIPAADVDGEALLGPALCLPYIPEAEPRLDRAPGSETLRAIAAATGGVLRDDVLNVFDNPPSPGSRLALAPWLIAVALFLLVGEILVRRLRLGSRIRSAPAAVAVSKSIPGTAPAQAAPPSNVPTVDPNAVPDVQAPDQGLHEALRHLRNRKR